MIVNTIVKGSIYEVNYEQLGNFKASENEILN
jgi:hypothetical protein